MGNFYYNCGLYDAQDILASKMDDLNDAIYNLDQDTDFKIYFIFSQYQILSVWLFQAYY